jgi:hypothetical protein
MKTFEQLVELWAAAPRAPAGQGTVRGIISALVRGRHERPERAELTPEQGVVGDRWRLSDDPERLGQVTIMNAAVAERIAHSRTPVTRRGTTSSSISI